MKILNTGTVTVTGGRDGHAIAEDGRLDVELSLAGSTDGNNSEGTNPEQLFAAAYAASFGASLKEVAQEQNLDIKGISVTASVELTEVEAGEKEISVVLDAYLPGVEVTLGEDLIKDAFDICPYSLATLDNIDVVLNLLVDDDDE